MLSLESENICINYTDDIDFIPSYIKKNNKETLIVYTPKRIVIHQFSYFKDNGYKF